MNWHLDAELARQKLAEARAWSRRQACLNSLQDDRQPVRVRVGLGLVRLGRWLADTADEPDRASGRVAA